MNDSGERLLVMGAAVGYNERQVAPFITSLRRSGYQGDVVLLTDRVLAQALRASRAFGRVIALEAPRWFPFKYGFLNFRRTHERRYALQVAPALFPLWALMRLSGWLPAPRALRRRLQVRVAAFAVSPTELRYLRFLEFLQAHDYSRILLSDVRDVVFQSNPFEHLPVQGLAVGMEAAQLTLAGEPWNAWAFELAYGREGLQRWGARPVSCSGVTCGDRESMLCYLEMMATEILSLRFRASWQPLDQALHNFVLCSGKLPFQRLASLEGPVATLSSATPGDIRLDGQSRLLNRDGSIISVVHQYDRVPGLAPVLLRSACGIEA